MCIIASFDNIGVDFGFFKLYTALMEKILKGYSVQVENGVVTGVTYDGSDSVTVAGLCDIHTHGAMGHDVSEATQEALDAVSKFYLDNGVTAFSPNICCHPS